MARRHKVEAFGLSFLDCICCGFGAVILFYTIVTAQAGASWMNRTEDLKSEVNRLEEEVLTGARNLVVLRNALEKTQTDAAHAAGRSTRIVEDLTKKREDLSTYNQSSLARREHIDKLKADIKALEEGARRLEGGSLDRAPRGQEIRAFRGTGDRRYITGLKMRGKRILILVDRSASMLHEDVVNVILLRNSTDAKKRQASKWRRAVDTVSWLVTQLPPGSDYQIFAFNTKVAPVVASTGGKWQSSADPQGLARNIEGLQALVPAEGTSLVNAFSATKTLSPLPDQIILITDGLPTQGASPPALRKYIDAGGRARLFDEAVGSLPDKVPTDIVLLPMKGDLPAAHRFWRLARLTGGVVLFPSKDWP